MLNVWSFRLAARFTDARPVLDVKYDIEKRIRRILGRDPERPALAFRDTSRSYTTADGTSTVELRLEAVYDTHNLYALDADFAEASDPEKEKKWEENVRAAFDRWTSGLALTEACAPFSPDRYRQVMQETIAREYELAHRVNPEEDAAIRAVQDAILAALRHGKSFSTAHHEGERTSAAWGRSSSSRTTANRTIARSSPTPKSSWRVSANFTIGNRARTIIRTPLRRWRPGSS